MAASPLKSALEELLKAHRLQADAPPLRGEKRFSPIPTGIAAVDEITGGGLPRGQVSEVYGPPSSGRTGLALAALARTVRGGALAAWVDPSDRLDPVTAAESGVDLGRVLWLRGGAGAPPLARAVSATGTLLGSGLFELVVLDLAGASVPDVARLPHATWLRLQRMVETGPGALLLLAGAHVAHGPAGVSLALSPAAGHWAGTGPGRLLTGLGVQARCGRGPRSARFDLQAFA